MAAGHFDLKQRRKKMIRENTVKKKLYAGEPLIMCFMCSSDPAVAEIMVMSGVDIVVIDNEHVLMDGTQITNIARAVTSLGGACLLRTTVGDRCQIGRFMDCGISGIIATMTTDYEKAKEVRDGVKYPPLGRRGLSTDGRAAHYGFSGMTPAEYMSFANDNTLLFFTLEDENAVSQLDKIAALEGIDGIHIGPMDLASSMGYCGDSSAPAVQKVLDEAHKKIASHGDPNGNSWLGYYAPDPHAVREVIERGGRIVNIGSELTALGKMLKQYKAELEAAK